MHNLHDTTISNDQSIRELHPLGILKPLPLNDLSPQKVRALIYNNYWKAIGNSLVMCYFTPWNLFQQTEILRAATGWNITTWELMKIGERIMNLTKIFNIREGLGKSDDILPDRFHNPTKNGSLSATFIDKNHFTAARDNYYEMMGWDINGIPKIAKLLELDLEWATELKIW
jgi:aldehyde:ferredoxin oxidoreductase